MTQITTKNDEIAIHSQVQSILEFLNDMGLPSDNIIADLGERQIMGKNLPEYIYALPIEIKQDARYLSKFVVGAGFGLFDYALNSVWNEVVLSLRKKAIAYGLDYFFDNAVGASLRGAYQREEDLVGLKDNTLLNTCKKLELISETTFKKLSHILDMRNDIGISHPTNMNINAFELLGWLQNCVQDVIQDVPSQAALQIKAFIDNLKEQSNIIDEATINAIIGQIKNLHTHHCDNIVRTLFGLFVNPQSSQILRKNISAISKVVWDCCSEEAKYNFGLILEGYKINLHNDKYKFGEEFFVLVEGNSYRSTNEKMLLVNNLLDDLRNTHYEWDNFYHEVPIAEKLASFINRPTDYYKENINKLVRYVLLCRIGKGTNYMGGVSRGAKEYYDSILLGLPEEYFNILIQELHHFEVFQKLSSERARNGFIEVLVELRKKIIIDKNKEILDYLNENLPKTESVLKNKHFYKITSTIIDWKIPE